jgi:hypothetical protein
MTLVGRIFDWEKLYGFIHGREAADMCESRFTSDVVMVTKMKDGTKYEYSGHVGCAEVFEKAYQSGWRLQILEVISVAQKKGTNITTYKWVLRYPAGANYAAGTNYFLGTTVDDLRTGLLMRSDDKQISQSGCSIEILVLASFFAYASNCFLHRCHEKHANGVWGRGCCGIP